MALFVSNKPSVKLFIDVNAPCRKQTSRLKKNISSGRNFYDLQDWISLIAPQVVNCICTISAISLGVFLANPFLINGAVANSVLHGALLLKSSTLQPNFNDCHFALTSTLMVSIFSLTLGAPHLVEAKKIALLFFSGMGWIYNCRGLLKKILHEE